MGAITPRGFKQVARVVAADQSSICRLRFNAGRLPIPQTDAGADVTAATMEVTANTLVFLVNAGAETVIGTYTGNSGADNVLTFGDTNCATVAQLIACINGQAPGQASGFRRWRAGLDDFRPQHVLGTGDGLVTAAANAMLGTDVQGLAVLADSSALATANVQSMGIGVPGARRGGGQTIPDHFETGFTSTTAGVRTPVREAGISIENQPGQANFQVFITDVQAQIAHTTTKVITAYDNAGNILQQEGVAAAANGTIAGTGNFNIDNPWAVGPPGSPVWVEVTGTGGVATAGSTSAFGYIRTF